MLDSNVQKTRELLNESVDVKTLLCAMKQENCSIPCLIWHEGREVMKRNDKYVFLYIRTIRRYLFTDWVLTNDCVLTETRVKNRLLWIFALSFSAKPFTGDATRGNNYFSLRKFITNNSWDCGSKYFAGGTGDRYKKRSCIWHSNASRRSQHSIFKHRMARKNKLKKI